MSSGFSGIMKEVLQISFILNLRETPQCNNALFKWQETLTLSLRAMSLQAMSLRTLCDAKHRRANQSTL
jgi:hypothetical protein